jgi:hypothetical protein
MLGMDALALFKGEDMSVKSLSWSMSEGPLTGLHEYRCGFAGLRGVIQRQEEGGESSSPSIAVQRCGYS